MLTVSTAANNYGLLLLALGIAAVGGYVLYKSPRNSINRSFFVLTSGATLFVAGIALLSITGNFLFDKCIHYGGLILVLGLFLFAQTFPARKEKTRMMQWYIYIPFVVAALFIIPSGLLVQNMVIEPDGNISPVIGPLLIWYGLGLGIYIIWSSALLILSYIHADKKTRLQLKYLMLGLGIFIACTLMSDVLLPALAGNSTFNLVGPMSSIVFFAAAAYAIIRHELMDIRVIIQRGLIYTALLALIISVYISLVMVVGFIFGTSPRSIFFSAGVTTVLGIFGVPFIERYFRKVTSKIFFKDEYDYGKTLHALSEALHRNVEFGAMEYRTREILEEVFHPQSISIRQSGEVVLGDKRSGDPYTAVDRRLIDTFSNQAAIAFERARLYDEVRRHAADLEDKVTMRTQELRLAQENQKQMMVDISHNLQTPLAIFQTKIERLKRAMPDDVEIRTFEKSLASLSAFTYDLLKLAKLEHGAPTSHTPFDLSHVFEEIAEEISVIATSRDIRVHSSITPHVVISGDAQQIREAIMNIASNAVKYMRPQGEKAITFSLEKDGTRATLSISDTGIGIPESDIDHIFERFYRAQKPREDVRGSGLGLAITKRIIESHGGTVSAKSTAHTGTTITIHLPLKREE